MATQLRTSSTLRPKIWFRDAKEFHYVYLPQIFFMFLGAAAAVLYDETVGISVSSFLYSVTGIDSNFSRVLIPLAVMLAVGFALMTVHLHKCKRFFAEELRDLTEPAGWKDTLVFQEPSELFHLVAESCKLLGFTEIVTKPGQKFLAIRLGAYGFGSADVVETTVVNQVHFELSARPLIPSRVDKTRYQKIIHQIRERLD